jgi:hypoxanthine phosphoribosyltransferase
MPKYEYLSHKDMNHYYADVVRLMAIEGFKPNVVVAPMRGGADFGVKISNYYNIPFVPLQWQTRDGNIKELTTLLKVIEEYKDKSILIVDDICDSGETLRCIQIATNFNRTNIRFAVAIENVESGVICDYAAREINRSDDTQWFVFPWEDWWRR